MHICFAIDSMHGGGAELSCLIYTQALLDRGHKVDLALLEFHGHRLGDIPESASLFALDQKFKNKSSSPARQFGETHWIKASRSLSSLIRYLKAIRFSGSNRMPFRWRQFRWTVAMADYIDQEKPDLIYANLFHAGAVSILARRISGEKIPIVWAARNHSQSVMNLRNLQQYEYLAPHADAIHANSKGVAENERKLIPANRNKVVSIYNPVKPDIHKLAAQPVSELSGVFANSSARNSDSEKKTYVVLAAGRLIKQKNFAMLIRAVAQSRQKKDIRLIILGEGPQRQFLESEAKKAGIENHLSMPGWTPNPYSYMSKSDLFVLCSNHEGFPNVLLDALASGCPVVSTDCPHGPREILEDGQWGRLTPVDDHIALSNAITEALDRSVDRDSLRGRAAEFTVDTSASQLEQLFKITAHEFNANPA